MSDPLFYATISGGELAPSVLGDGQFKVVHSNGIDPLCVFLSKDEAAQWAAVLTEWADEK